MGSNSREAAVLLCLWELGTRGKNACRPGTRTRDTGGDYNGTVEPEQSNAGKLNQKYIVLSRLTPPTRIQLSFKHLEKSLKIIFSVSEGLTQSP